MSIEDRLQDAARAVSELWADPMDTAERLCRVQERLAQQPAPTPVESTVHRAAPPKPSAGERPLSEVAFLTVAEVASVMRVSKMTVYKLVHNGHLPAIRVGRSFRVPENAVHEYLRETYSEVEAR